MGLQDFVGIHPAASPLGALTLGSSRSISGRMSTPETTRLGRDLGRAGIDPNIVAGMDINSVLRELAAAGGLDSLLDLGDGEGLDSLLDFGFGDGAGGAGGAAAFGSTEAGARLAQQFALEQLSKEQAFRAAEDEKQRQFQRDQALEELKAERQRIFTDMLGTDPVRAVLFAMGVGGEILPGGERFADLPALKGAGAQAQSTEQALTSILGGDIGLGKSGVTGLPSAVKAATAFSAGQGASGDVGDLGAARTLLTSALGVGATKGKGRPGMSRQETLRQIASVTPQGALGT